MVVSRNRVGETGQDIDMTTRPASAASAPCAYAPKPGDLIVESDSASVLRLQGRMLVLEASTGPDGRLLIYDGDRRRKLIDVDDDDAREPVATPRSITYRRVGAKPVTASPCPAEGRADKDNASAKQAHRNFEVRFTMADAKARDTGLTGCRLKQEDVESFGFPGDGASKSENAECAMRTTLPLPPWPNRP